MSLYYRQASVVVSRLSTLFKTSAPQKPLDQSVKISYRTSVGWGNKILFSHGRLPKWMAGVTETCYTALRTPLLPSLFKWRPQVDLWTQKSYGSVYFCMGKCLNSGFVRNFCSLWRKRVGLHFKLNLYLRYSCAWGQGHSLGHSELTSSTFSSIFSETTWSIIINFI